MEKRFTLIDFIKSSVCSLSFVAIMLIVYLLTWQGVIPEEKVDTLRIWAIGIAIAFTLVLILIKKFKRKNSTL